MEGCKELLESTYWQFLPCYKGLQSIYFVPWTFPTHFSETKLQMIRRDPRIHAEAVTASQFAPSAAVFSQVKKNGGQHSKNVWAWGKQAARTDRAPEIVKGGKKAEGRTRFQNGLWVCTTSSFRAAKAGCHGRGTHNEEGQDKTTWKWPSTGESWMKPAGSEKRMSNSTRRRGTVGTAFSPKFFGSSTLHELGRCGQKHVILGGGFTYFFFSPTWGSFLIWLICFNWVETTN